MPIEITDPDELDDDSGWRTSLGRRRVVVISLIVATVVAVTAAAWSLTRQSDPSAGPSSSVTVESTTDETLPDVGVNAQPAVVPGFPDWGSDYCCDKLDLLYQRTTDTGITVTVQNSGDWGAWMNNLGGIGLVLNEEAALAVVPAQTDIAVPGSPTTSNSQWAPADWCNPIGSFRVSMTYQPKGGALAIGTSSGQRWGGFRDGAQPTLFSSGFAEGTPFRVLVVQVEDRFSEATVDFGDGLSDTAAIVDGWVVLATPGPQNGIFTLTLTGAGGQKRLAWQDFTQEGGPEWVRACNPPPVPTASLPVPGADQPSDPAAAEQQIRAVFDALFDSSIEPKDKPDDLLDDPTGIDIALEEVRNGSFGELARSAVYILNDMVFTTAEQVWFDYDIQTDTNVFAGRFGVANLIDGKWRIARAVVCQDLALAGVQCDPSSAPLIPPGSEFGVPGPIPIRPNGSSNETTAPAD